MKHALSSYLVKHIFVITWKARSEFRIRGLLGICTRNWLQGASPPELRSALLPFPPPAPLVVLRGLAHRWGHPALRSTPPQGASAWPRGTHGCDIGRGRGRRRLGAIQTAPLVGLQRRGTQVPGRQIPLARRLPMAGPSAGGGLQGESRSLCLGLRVAHPGSGFLFAG